MYTSGGSSTNYGLYVNRGLGYFGGNVGIGSTNPSELLTLSGASGPIIGLNGATTNYRGIKMSNSV